MTRQDCQRSACLDMHMLYTLAQYRSGLTIYFFISKLGSFFQIKSERLLQILRAENNRGWIFHWMPQSLNKMFFFLSKHALIGSTSHLEMLTDSCVCVWGLKTTIMCFKYFYKTYFRLKFTASEDNSSIIWWT